MNRLPPLDMLSFWIGFIVASIFWAIIASVRPALRNALEMLKQQRQEARLRAGSSIEDNHRRNICQQTQEMHLAASLFSLSEITIEPRLMTPPSQSEPGAESHHRDIVEKTLPYLPETPELGTFYGEPGLGLAEALSGEVNLVITGQPGSGKSTALAYLACQVAEQSPATASLNEHLPFLFHIAELGLPLAEVKKAEDVLAPIIEAQSARTRIIDKARIPTFVQQTFQSGRALLLLDGLDEMPQPQVQEASNYLRVLLRAYPKTRIIAAAAPEYIDGLLQLGFMPTALQAWSTQEQTALLNNWDSLWQKYVKDEAWAQTAPNVDTLLLKRWLSQDNLGLTPLEYTLKIWAAYAGDVRGSSIPDHIEAHIRRLAPAEIPAEALQVLASQSSLSQLAAFEEKQASEWVRPFEQALSQVSLEPAPGSETATSEAESAIETTQDGEKAPAKKAAPVKKISVVNILTKSGLLKKLPKNRLSFSHPVLADYLTSQALSAPGAAEPMLKQPDWSRKTQVMRYLAAFSDATPLIQSLLVESDPVLLRPQRTTAMLVRYAPRNAPWRNTAIASLLEILQNDDYPLALRGEIATNFALSKDPQISALFRQLLQAPSDKLRQLAALTLGLMRDTKAVEPLASLLSLSIGPTQQTACLALVAIGTPPALESVAAALLGGDEDLRQSAAEALANDPHEGREALREGIGAEDILLRRAIVYGLARVPEAWADELLQKTQIEDNQWAVRNVAVELLESRKRPNPRIPRRLREPSEMPWLVEFAGRQGMGISPGQATMDMLLQAFKGNNPEEQRAALAYLRHKPSEGIIGTLYHAYFVNDHPQRELVYQILKEYASGGVSLPAPMQFGLG
jgi:hypothetical protein